MEERDGGRRWLLTERKREMGRGSTWAVPHEGRRRGVRLSATSRGGEWGLASGSCAGAAETGVGIAVSSAVWKQVSGRRTWAARESLGRPGEGRSWAGLESNSANFLFKRNFSNWTRFDLIRSWLYVDKKIQIKYGFVGNSIRNNFPYCNFSKFGLEFELKIGKVLGVEFEWILIKNDWNLEIWWNLNQRLPIVLE
jgi:hypothetical protein